MHDDRKSEIRRQSFRDRSPRMSVIVAAKYADIRPRATRARPVRPASVVLHVEPSGRCVMPRDLMDALAEFRIGVRLESRADPCVRCLERLTTVFAQIMAARRDAEMDAIAVADDRMHAEAPVARRPLARVLVVADPRHHLPRGSAVVAFEQ